MAAIDVSDVERDGHISSLRLQIKNYKKSSIVPALQKFDATTGDATGHDVYQLWLTSVSFLNDANQKASAYNDTQLAESWKQVSGDDVPAIRTDLLGLRDAVITMLNLIENNWSAAMDGTAPNRATGKADFVSLTGSQRAAIKAEIDKVAALINIAA